MRPNPTEETTMLALTNDEASELGQLLDAAISDLSMEIANTDNPAFKASLRARREALRSVSEKLASIAA